MTANRSAALTMLGQPQATDSGVMTMKNTSTTTWSQKQPRPGPRSGSSGSPWYRIGLSPGILGEVTPRRVRDPAGADVPPEVLDLMKRVTIIPSHTMTLFGPRITIYTKNGKSYTRQGTGREFIWDFDEEARRIRDAIPVLPIPPAQFEAIIATCRDLDRRERADALVQLTLKQA